MLTCVVALVAGQTIARISTSDQLRIAAANARPGDVILLRGGEYRGGVHLSGLRGEAGRQILIAAADPKDPPRFVGGGSGLQLSGVAHVELRDLTFERAAGNGLNVDDGGEVTKPSRHVVLTRIRVRDLPKGNNDGIKLSGVEDFRVESCTVERWGGSAVDMVGCHRGVIQGCLFKDGGDSGVQAKGGSSDVRVLACRFVDYGQRGVNIGGSTGAPYFRPPLAAMGDQKYEARSISVQGSTFVRGVAPIAFVGVDGATVSFNTIVEPERWALRILQETREAGFVPCRRGVFSDNLVVFRSSWASGGVNVGPETQPQTFRFARNWWYCADAPDRSRPPLPTAEDRGRYGRDPQLTIAPDGTATVTKGSPAGEVGAHAFVPSPRAR